MGGRGGHNASVDCCLKLVVPTGLSPLTPVLSLNPFPLQAAVPIGLSPPGTLDLPVLPVLTSPPFLPFPWWVVPTEPPDCPCVTALRPVYTEGGGPGGDLQQQSLKTTTERVEVALSSRGLF